MDNKTKVLLSVAIILIGLGGLLVWESRNFGKLRVVFCDIGQGDGMLIISPGGNEVVVDGGPGNKMLDCLSSHMPFWDRTVELIVSTHPQADHQDGLTAILGKYKVKTVVTTGMPNTTQSFKKWQQTLSDSKAAVYDPEVGDVVLLDPKRGDSSAKLTMLWPAKVQIAAWQDPNSGQKLPDLNNTGIVARLSYGQFCAYLTADVPKEILQAIFNQPCAVLKVAHHGSRTGTSELELEEAAPQLAVIQVGKNNRYGHPHKETLDLLASKGIKLLRNDINGTVEVYSDGKSYKVKTR